MAAALGVVPAAMEDGPCKKWYDAPQLATTIKGKELPGLAVSRLAALLCTAVRCHSATKKKKERKERKGKKKEKAKKEEKEERNEAAGMLGPVEHRHSCKSPQRCWGWFPLCLGAGHCCDQLSQPAGSS